MADLKQLFIPITKVDAVKRLVYGVAAVEEVDKADEIFDYASSKPLFEAWSADAQKFSGGKSYGNVRAMHGKVAAGRLDQIAFNDDDLQIEVCAKVVDDNEWTKVEEGVYTGFSIGGKYEKRWKDGDYTRYTASPSEVSIVDNPCQTSARFTMVKMDGSTEERPFAAKENAMAVSNDQVAARARELAKAAGDETKWAAHVEAARVELDPPQEPVAKAADVPEVPAAQVVEPAAAEVPAVVEPVLEVNKDATPANPSAELEQVWKAKDGTTFSKKADAVAHNETLAKAENPAAQLTAGLADLTKTVEAAEVAKAFPPADDKKDEDAAPKDKKDGEDADPKDKKDGEDADPKDKKKGKKDDAKKATPDELQKGLYAVGRLASLIQDLVWLSTDAQWEADAEGDESPLPAKLKADAASLCASLRQMVVEETDELFANDEGIVIETFEMADRTQGVNALMKVMQDGLDGLEKDALDKRTHQTQVLAKVGARNSKKDASTIQKMHDHSVDLGATCADAGAEKAAPTGDLAKVTQERDDLQKAVSEALPVIKDLQARMKKMEDQPLPRPGETSLRVVDKAVDDALAATAANNDVVKMIQENPDAVAAAFIKIAQQAPKRMNASGR